MTQISINGAKVELPEGVSLVTNADGSFGIVINGQKVNDATLSKIAENGRIYNGHLVKRWVMAQMFKILNSGIGFTDYVNNYYTYDYQFLTRIRDEVNTLAHMEKDRDTEALKKEATFWGKEVIVNCYKEYFNDLVHYIGEIKVRHCHGYEYKRIGNKDVFIDSINDSILNPMFAKIVAMSYAKSYKELKAIVNYFNDHMYIKMNHVSGLNKCKSWMEAFKGYGAFFTLENMVLSHGVKLGKYDELNKARSYSYITRIQLKDAAPEFVKGDNTYDYLVSKLDTYQPYQFMGMLRKCIEDNNFKFEA